MDEFRLRVEIYKAILRVVWKTMIIPSLYLIMMWASVTAAVFLIFGDLVRAAGIVSALALYQITQAEFTKEFFGARNGIQK